MEQHVYHVVTQHMIAPDQALQPEGDIAQREVCPKPDRPKAEFPRNQRIPLHDKSVIPKELTSQGGPVNSKGSQEDKESTRGQPATVNLIRSSRRRHWDRRSR